MTSRSDTKNRLRSFQKLQAKFLIGMFASGLVLLCLSLLFAVSWRYSRINISPYLFIVIILSVLALVIPGLLLHRSVVRRLRMFIETTKRIAEGDLSERVEIEARDEIGELADAFNEMTTNLQRNMLEVQQNKSFTEKILSSIEHGIIVIDEDFRLVTFNKAYFNDETSLKKLVGKPCYRLHRHETVDCRSGCPASVTFSTGESARDIHKHIKDDGTEIVVEVFSSPLRDTDGNVNKVILVSKDITHRLEMEEKLLRSDKMALVGQMASGLAHEIKNPITGISAAIQVISQSLNEDDPNREIFEEIQNQIIRMKRTLSDLLRYAKPRKPQLIESDINDLIRKIIALMEPNAKSQNISMDVELSKDLPYLQVDPDMIQQVLLNLCLNAIQAQKSGGRILLHTDQDDDGSFVVVTLKDEGPGISPEVLGQIFDPFYTTKHTGTGLGLTICQQIIEEHKGRLEINSEEKKGTTCRIRLPLSC